MSVEQEAKKYTDKMIDYQIIVAILLMRNIRMKKLLTNGTN